MLKSSISSVFISLFILLLPRIGSGEQWQWMMNQPYVYSQNYMYAKAVPLDKTGASGVTKIYRVFSREDMLVGSYDWYNYYGILLHESYIQNDSKFSVLRKFPDENNFMSLYFDGKFLRSYPNAYIDELNTGFHSAAMDAPAKFTEVEFLGAAYIKELNQRTYWEVDIKGFGVKRFDVITGEEFSGSYPEGFIKDKNMYEVSTIRYKNENDHKEVKGIVKKVWVEQKWAGQFFEEDGTIGTYKDGVRIDVKDKEDR